MIRFQGKREHDELVQFALDAVANDVVVVAGKKDDDSPIWSEKSDVIALDDATFDASVSKGKWMIAITGNWCGFCRRLAPTYEAVAAQVKGEFNLGYLEAGKTRRPRFQFNITAVPTIYVIEGNQMWDVPYRSQSVDVFVKLLREGEYKSSEAKPIPAFNVPPIPSTNSIPRPQPGAQNNPVQADLKAQFENLFGYYAELYPTELGATFATFLFTLGVIVGRLTAPRLPSNSRAKK